MNRPRVLLVEDDPSLRRFVALALDELDIQLLRCASVAEAVEVLSQGPVRLVLTDLMMPGESGLACCSGSSSPSSCGATHASLC